MQNDMWWILIVDTNLYLSIVVNFDSHSASHTFTMYVQGPLPSDADKTIHGQQ